MISSRFILLLILFSSLISINKILSQRQYFEKKVDTTLIKQLEEKVKQTQNSNPEQCIKIIDTLIDIYTKSNQKKELFIAKVHLAHCYNSLQRNYLSMGIYEQCIKYFTETKDSLYLFHIFTGIGNINFYLKNFEKAKQYYSLAVQTCDEKKFPHHKFVSFSNLASCYIEFKNYDSATHLYAKCKQLIPKITKKGYYARYSLNSSYLHLKQNKYLISLKEALLGIDSLRSETSRVDLKMSLYEIIGLSYLGLKQTQKAKTYLDSASILSSSFNSNYNNYDLLKDYVMLDTTLHQYKSAVDTLFKMLNLKDSLYAIDQNNLSSDLLIEYETEKKDQEKKALEDDKRRQEKTIIYQRNLLIVIVLLSVISASSIYFFLRVRSKQQKAKLEKEKVTAQLKALQSQLNPHFIQNIFQIVANQVASNPTNVSLFLQHTSSYLRSVLAMSESESQSLEDELIFNEKYLQFQQSLFQDKLQYTFKIAEEIDTFDTLIPSMILQPFFENSIKYGLQKNNQPIEINLDINIQNDFLKIVIEDNAIQTTSDDIKTEKKSYGNQLIKERLNLYYSKFEHLPILTTGKKENGIGFKVELLLPLK